MVSESMRSIRLFDRSTTTRRSPSSTIKWLTWSDSLRQFVAMYKSELREMSRPRVIEVRGCEPYQWTYDMPVSRLGWLPKRDMRALARALEKTTSGPALCILDGLIDEEIDSALLLSLFVLFRTCLVFESGSPSRAMCRPVNPVSRDPGFPLHSDLYIHRNLMVVFDDVTNTGGASIFLSAAVLTRLLEDNLECPTTVRRRVSSLLRGRRTVDRFDELYDLLHKRKHPWVPELERRMSEKQLQLQLRRGQGYLIDDHAWLHGRLASNIPVRARRFRRIAF